MAYIFKGSWELTPEQCGEIYDAAVAERKLDIVLFAREYTRDDFITEFQAASAATSYDDQGQPRGFIYLTSFEGRTARLHFCPFGVARPYLYDLAGAAMEWAYRVYDLDALLGAVPVINQGACRFAEAMGGVSLGVIPGLCYIRRLGRHVDGAMYLFKKQEG
jgi:hypothetical protein